MMIDTILDWADWLAWRGIYEIAGWPGLVLFGIVLSSIPAVIMGKTLQRLNKLDGLDL